MPTSIRDSNDAAVIVLSIIGVITTIVLYVLFPLPIAWKKLKHINLVKSPQPSSYFAVDFPSVVILPTFCYNVWGVSNVVARIITITSLPSFPYLCLQLSHMIAIFSLAVYGYIFMMTQDMRCGGPLLLQQFLCLLSFLIPYAGLIMLLCFLNFTGITNFSGTLYTILGIIMYASPLPIVMNSRKMKTVQYFAMWLSVLFFFNAFAWFLVALVASPCDPYLFITNGVGAILGLVHLGIIVNSTWSTEIPCILECWILLFRERGLFYTVKSMMDIIEVNERATKPEPNETAASEENDFCVEVNVQEDGALLESSRPK